MALLKECGGYVGGKVVAKLGDEVAPGLAPAQKNPKNRLKKPTSKWGFWVLLGFFKFDLYFLCKSHCFLIKCLWKSFNLC
jgi:hypothetical protein